MDDSAMLTPTNMTAEPIRLESSFEVAQGLLDAIDAQIALAILGNSLTTGEGRGAGIGSGTQAKAHSKSEDKQTWSDAKRIEATLNQTLIKWLVEANFPGAVAPKINFDPTVRPDVTDRIDMLTKIGNMKRSDDGEPFQFSERWLRETFNIPAPDSEDDAPTEKKSDAFVFVAPVPAALGGSKEEEKLGDNLEKTKTVEKEEKNEKLSVYEEDTLDVWGKQFATRFAGVYRMIGKSIMENVA
jgi:phage gp29-like protein